MSIVTYLRSSSMGTFKICQHRHFIEYILNMRPPDDAYEKYGELDYMRAMKAASKGSAVHKVLEIIARRKKSMQDGVKEFYDDELEQTFVVNSNDCDVKNLIPLAIEYYKKDSQSPWSSWDEKNVRDWVWTVMKSDWNPARMDIVEVEKFFNFEIKEDWAKYRYELDDGSILEGYLAVRGTIDLIVQNGNTYNIRDWKTGKKYKYDEQREKTYEDLCEDHQLLLYYWVGKQLYPDKNIEVEINYIKEDGVSSPYMDASSFKMGYQNLQKFFTNIQEAYPPQLIKYNFANPQDGPCGFCPWKSIIQINDTRSVCEFMEEKTQQYSAAKVLDQYGDISKINSYDGGGKTLDLTKERD